LQDDRHRLSLPAEERQAFGFGKLVLRDGVALDLMERLLEVRHGLTLVPQGELGLGQV
jgi:hypothetical protein